MCIRQGCQIAKHTFLVAWNGIKWDVVVNVFNVYLTKLSRSWGKYSSTALVLDTFYVKYCSPPQFRDNYLDELKNCITTSNSYGILCSYIEVAKWPTLDR